MKFLNIKKIFYIFVVTLLFTACIKDDAAEKIQQTESSLVGKRWQLKSSMSRTVAGGQQFTGDAYANLRPCERDNFLLFNADKTLTRDEGPTKCAAADPQTLQGLWRVEFDGVSTILRFNDGLGVINAEVLSQTETSLRIRYRIEGSVVIVYESEYITI
jgi:hypothetical protein